MKELQRDLTSILRNSELTAEDMEALISQMERCDTSEIGINVENCREKLTEVRSKVEKMLMCSGRLLALVQMLDDGISKPETSRLPFDSLQK